uniref:N-acetyltransferase domain-containing protein n=1 Tax=Coccolithus braarudii TaxID=221442 RepID=A0A7S0Q0H6_9EUKA|mmetsp:Transcript_34163/g.72929  ORF Transcript_34163/g.72929 Transcript_34163/m.72929 type:complete len:168 (+) Transcript_34163:1-504(+)
MQDALLTNALRVLSVQRGPGSPLRVAVMRARAEEVVCLREQVLWPGKPEMCILKEDESPGSRHFMAVVENTPDVIGVVSLFLPTGEDGRRSQFRKLAVDADWRNHRLGRTLIEVAIAEARSAGAGILFCHARLEQGGFYEVLGFRRCGEPFQKYGSGQYVTMELKLQ